MKSAIGADAHQPTSRLLLFVAGDSPNSLAALENLRLAMEDQGAEHFRLEIVDVFTSPERALADQIIVTPTLLRVAPASSHRLIGDLSARADLISFIKVQR
jgi:circadian clock protein KaiB